MKLRAGLAAVTACGLAAIMSGCGGEIGGPTPVRRSPTQSSYDRRHDDGTNPAATGAASVSVLEHDYHGWASYELTNGIVSLVAVPAIGGRVMQYRLGADSVLWVNEDERGQLYGAPRNEAERVWHNFGGYKVWPAPQSDWGGPPDPLGSALDGGQWTGEMTAASGQAAGIRLVSPLDQQVTGLQVTREITMQANTTEVRIAETFTNLSQRTIAWSIWDVTQVPGLVDAGGQPTGKGHVFVPLNPDSRTRGGYWTSPGQTETEQYRTVDEGRLLQVTYLGQRGKVFADSAAGWVAYVNDELGLTYVKRFEVDVGAEYPDDGATVEVYTSSGLPYMEVEVLSRLRELAPGDSLTFSETWHVTRLNAPVLEVAEAAAIGKRLTVEVTDEGLHLTGKVGVFAPGEIRIALVDNTGAQVAEPVSIPASPNQTVVLDQVIKADEGARSLTVALTRQDGQGLGTIATVALPAAGADTQPNAARPLSVAQSLRSARAATPTDTPLVRPRP